MEPFQDRAIVLQVRDQGDAHQWVTLLTETRGKMTVFAAAARKSRKRFGGGLDLGTLLNAQFSERREGRLQLESVDIEQSLPAIRDDLASLARAFYCLELVRELVRENESQAELFALLADYLTALNEKSVGPTSLLAFQLDVLTCAGLKPRLDVCTLCAQRADEFTRFDPEHGGVVCKNCWPRLTSSWTLTGEVLGHLRALQLGEKKPMAKPSRDSAQTLLDKFIIHQLGKPIRSRSFLAQMGE